MIKALVGGGLLALSAAALASQTVPAFRCPAANGNLNRVTRDVNAEQLGSLALPELRYQCFNSMSGTALLIGQAGEQHEQTLLLVHGLGTNGHLDWQETIPLLSQRYHVVTVDLPGFGGSSAANHSYVFPELARLLNQVISQYAVDKAIVLGHSLGAAIALDFAHRYPEQVERLVLIDVAGILQKQVFANHVAQWPLPQHVGVPPLDRILGGVGRQIDTIKRTVLNWPDRLFDITRFLRENPQLRALILRDQVMIDAAVGLIEADFSAAIRETRTPTIILWGSDDPITPVRTGRLLASRLTNARLFLVPGARHIPMREAPGEFLRLLNDGLQWPISTSTPLPTTSAVTPAATRPNWHCQNQTGVRYTGAIGTVTLENCHDVRIEDADIQQLVMRQASAELFNVDIHATETAVRISKSKLIGTAINISGQLAIHADDSRLDLAGARLRGHEHVVRVELPSVLYLSVSEWQSNSGRRDRHEVLALSSGSY